MAQKQLGCGYRYACQGAAFVFIGSAVSSIVTISSMHSIGAEQLFWPYDALIDVTSQRSIRDSTLSGASLCLGAETGYTQEVVPGISIYHKRSPRS